MAFISDGHAPRDPWPELGGASSRLFGASGSVSESSVSEVPGCGGVRLAGVFPSVPWNSSWGGWAQKGWSGMEWSGMEWSGMEWNGMEWNGKARDLPGTLPGAMSWV